MFTPYENSFIYFVVGVECNKVDWTSPHQNPEHSFSDIVPTMSPMTNEVEEDEETSQQSSEDSSFFVDTAANNTNVTTDQSHIGAIHDLLFGGEDKENTQPSESFDDDRGIV